MKNFHKMNISVTLCTLMLAGCASNEGGGVIHNPLNDSIASAHQAGQAGQAIQGAGQTLDSGMGAANAVASGQDGIVQLLTSQLGISQGQATGGAGSIFRAARENMTPQAFTTVSQSVPDMDNLLAAAPTLPAAGLLGGASSILGGGSQPGSAAALASAFQQLNLSPDMIGQFLPIITNSIESTGGSAAAGLLRSALNMP
ncbi:MAG: DUF2780 domain-containing protein [Nitrosomonas sp.]|nr:DUF2780 domain-containing protein [Nitrosomonas sp.]